MAEEILDRKSQGMAWALRSAFGYWDTKSGGLNSTILSRYYALLQISIAEQIASSNPADDLTSIQRHTEHGHGLFTIAGGHASFPANFFVGCLNSGHFSACCRNLGIDLGPYTHGRRPREFADLNVQKAVSLSELLCRVPEFQGVIREYIHDRPLSFHIGHATKNHIVREQRMKEHTEKTGSVVFDPPVDGPTIVTFVAIFSYDQQYTADELNSLALPIRNISAEKDPLNNKDYFVGELEHPKGEHWWQHLDTYKSGYSGTSLILPFWALLIRFCCISRFCMRLASLCVIFQRRGTISKAEPLMPFGPC
jgi:hypothetical protein